MAMNRLVSYSKSDTFSLARQLYCQLKNMVGKKALIIALEGPLGSGKTTFAKAFARTMGITETVLSPTFTLHSEYDQLDHIDLWRVEDPKELLALGLEKMIQAKKIIIVEWAEKVKQLLLRYQDKARIIWVRLEYGDKENERRISYEDFGH